MTEVSNAAKVVRFPFRPIGFKPTDGKTATLEEIKNWKEREKPNVVQEQSFLTIGGAISTIIGLVASVIGYKNEGSFTKWTGAGLTLLGIIGVAISKLAGINLTENSDIKTSIAETDKVNTNDDKNDFFNKLEESIRNSDLDYFGSLSGKVDFETDTSTINKFQAEINKLVAKYGQENVLKWIDEIISDKTVSGKNIAIGQTPCLAVLCYALIGDNSTFDKLLKYSKDDQLHYEVNIASLKGIVLRKLYVEKNPEIVTHFINQLNDKTACLKSVIMLGKLGDKRVIEPLSKLISTDPDLKELTEESIIAIAKIKDPEALKYLAEFTIRSDSLIRIYTENAIQRNKDYIIECLLNNSLDQDRAFMLTKHLNLDRFENETIKESLIQWANESVTKYLSREITEPPKAAIWIMSKVNPDLAEKYLLEHLNKYLKEEVNNYPLDYLSSLSRSPSNCNEIGECTKAIVKKLRTAGAKLPDGIGEDLGDLVGYEEAARIVYG